MFETPVALAVRTETLVFLLHSDKLWKIGVRKFVDVLFDFLRQKR